MERRGNKTTVIMYQDKKEALLIKVLKASVGV